ncbi:hypothetical protein C5167_006628 [Papaver somniferum]|uniref:Uncharacterized protein n=1 Tax=Papaver somniferum TaxID=3469 RepID=A0A4Y7JET7_PAPSO|nr:hypothetical protein C5167_006628 [Papaver somniferum]
MKTKLNGPRFSSSALIHHAPSQQQHKRRRPHRQPAAVLDPDQGCHSDCDSSSSIQNGVSFAAIATFGYPEEAANTGALPEELDNETVRRYFGNY